MMKKTSIALLVALTAGCALLNPPPSNDDQGGGEQQQQAQGGVDATQFVQAPGRVPVASEARVGWMAERTTQASGQTLVESYALVGESGDAWLVESKSPTIDAMAASFPDLKGALLGLTVRKSDGVVTKAVMGKPGEDVKEIKIAPAGDAVVAPKDEGTADRVSIGLGTFDAMKHTHGEISTWVGSAGETEGVLLKSQGGGQDYELAEMPTKETKDVGGVSVSVTGLSFTNGMKLWMTDNEIIAALLGAGADAKGKRVGVYRTESGGNVTEVTGLGTEAKPQLKW
ncbi:MAG: hypothetical protein M9894_22695 [Planctomycetes bacterium]|nr:hypothetical protein [Planctomycetota bacterium]